MTRQGERPDCASCGYTIPEGCVFGYRKAMYCAMCVIDLAHEAHCTAIMRSAWWRERQAAAGAGATWQQRVGEMLRNFGRDAAFEGGGGGDSGIAERRSGDAGQGKGQREGGERAA